MSTLALLFALVAQDGTADRVKKLVEALGSEAIAQREAAEGDIRSLGVRAREHLKRYAEHDDAEIRGRVQALLRDVALLGIDDALRGAMKKLEALEMDPMREAIGELLAVDRAKLKEALAVCAADGGELLRFRAKQLLDVVGGEPMGWIRYGIVVAQPEALAAKPIEGVELWINESDRPFALQEARGTPRFEELDPKPDGGGMSSATFTLEEPGPKSKSFALPARKFRVEARADFRLCDTSAAKAGRYRLACTYSSDDDQVEPGDTPVWFGSLKSNRVELRVR